MTTFTDYIDDLIKNDKDNEDFNKQKFLFNNFLNRYSKMNTTYLNTDKIFNICKNIYNEDIRIILQKEELTSIDISRIIDIVEYKVGDFLGMEFDHQSSFLQRRLTKYYCYIFTGKDILKNTKYDC